MGKQLDSMKQHLTDAIASRIEVQGWAQGQAAEVAGENWSGSIKASSEYPVSRNQINEIVNGNFAAVSLERLANIALALGVRVSINTKP